MSHAKRAIPIGGDPCPPQLQPGTPGCGSGPSERLGFVLRELRRLLLPKGG